MSSNPIPANPMSANPTSALAVAVTREQLLAEHDWLRGLAVRLVTDPERADDAVQELYAHTLSKPPSGVRSLRGWLATALRHRIIATRRSDERRRAREVAAARAEVTGSTVEIVEEADARSRVVETVMELEEPYRTTVLLRFFEGLPPREISVRMDVPTETVRTRTRRALTVLRARLDRTYGTRTAWTMALVPLCGPEVLPSPPSVGSASTGAAAVVARLTAAAVVGGAVALGVSAAASDPVATVTVPGAASADVDTLRDTLVERDQRIRALTADVRRLQGEVARANERVAAAAANAVDDTVPTRVRPTASATPRVTDTAAGQQLGAVDWVRVGRCVLELIQLQQALVVHLDAERDAPREQLRQMQVLDEELMMALGSKLDGLPGESPLGGFTQPSVVSNMLDATLATADVPLDATQLRRLQSLVDDHTRRDVTMRANFDDESWKLERLVREARHRAAFSAAMFELLTDDQRRVVRPASTAGRLKLDLFTHAAVIMRSVTPRPRARGQSFEGVTAGWLRETVRIDAAERPELSDMIVAWAAELPSTVTSYVAISRSDGRFVRADYALESAEMQLELLRRIDAQLELTDGERARLRQTPATFVAPLNER